MYSEMDRRKFMKSVGSSIAVASLASCIPSTKGKGPHGSNNVQLIYQDCRCRGEQLMIQQFYESHPNIQVFYTPDPENFEEKMLADLQAGTAPDIMVGCCDFFPIWAQKGFLLNLRPYVQAEVDSDTILDWDKAQYQSFFGQNGLQYALPKYHGSLALLYNLDLFDKYSVEYPNDSWTHDDYLKAMRLLSSATNPAIEGQLWGSIFDISWERIQVHVNGWNGHLVSPLDNTKSALSEPEALAAMEWLRSCMWDEHVMASPTDVNKVDPRQAFIQQKVAMVEEGSWALKDILDAAQFRIGVIPFPSGPSRKVTLATTDGFAIYAETKYPEAAWEFMKFLISKEYGIAMAKAELLQPARASLVDQWAQIIQEEYPQAAKDLDLAAFAEGQQKGYSVTAEVFANMADALRLTKAAWEKIFVLGEAPVSILVDTAAQIEITQVANKQ